MTRAASPDSLAQPAERVIPVDAEHFSIRLLVPVLTVVATVLFHIVGLLALNRAGSENTSAICILLPLDGLVLLTAGLGIERVLKRLLPSRRSARLSHDGLTLTDARSNPPDVREIDWDRALNVSTWYFVVRRRTRIPKGWYCMALHLLQDDTEIILYAFMSPADAEVLPEFPQFVRLRPRKETETVTDLRLAATQRRLLRLEDARWTGGAEIAASDFAAVLARLAIHAPVWL
jgi:hypothetical protein